MITILSIVIPIIIFLAVLWTIEIIQRHWIKQEREKLEQTAAANRAQRRDEPRVCEECGASGPDVLFINQLCLNCYEKQRLRDQARTQDREWDESSTEMGRYYRILGCTKNDSDQEVKRQYHRKAKELHPDSLRGQDLSEELIKLRTAEFQKLHEAYTKILKHRVSHEKVSVDKPAPEE